MGLIATADGCRMVPALVPARPHWQFDYCPTQYRVCRGYDSLSRLTSIAFERVIYVIAHCATVLVQPPPEDDPDDNDERLVFLGDDQNGVPLEVMAIELEPDDGQDILLVIHAQKLRPTYRDDYECVRGY